jgi:sentrin-specific protease 7
MQKEKAKLKKSWDNITLVDFKRSESGFFLNDTLLDFWLIWITRNESEKDFVIYVFNAKFYTKMLEEDGVKKVTNWTTKWDLDIFHKRMLFIPIHKEFHWSLCIV